MLQAPVFRAGGQASLRRSVRHRRATAGSREDALESSEAATEHFPSDDFVSRARVRSASEYDALYARSISEPQAFWSEIARGFHWETPFNDSPASCSFTDRPVTWFEGGRTNVCYNCLDRHVASGKGDVVAFHVERHARGRTSSVTYGQLLALVCQVANALVSLGVNTGDTVLIYLPQRIHTVATMLACARLGAPHCVVFAGFSAEALAQRIVDCAPAVVVTSFAARRGADPQPLKHVVDDAIAIAQHAGVSVPAVLITDADDGDGDADGSAEHSAEQCTEQHTEQRAERLGPADVLWRDVVPRQAATRECVWVGSEHPLFVLHTSGSTGAPKGVVHTTGGYMVYVATAFRYVFDHRDGDVFWATGDCGWIMGHSTVVYGPMLCCATQVLFEGSVGSFPDPGRVYSIIESHSVSVFFTAPTAVRALMRLSRARAAGAAEPARGARSASLRLLGSAGEPIGATAWSWYFNTFGGGRCPIVDTYWQTETGCVVLSTLPGAHAMRPSCAGLPFFGIVPVIMEPTTRRPVVGAGAGVLCFASPWPGIARTLLRPAAPSTRDGARRGGGGAGDSQRFTSAYLTAFPGLFCTGDGARRSTDGWYTLTGRVDDVVNVSGHRLGTAEVEAALCAHPSVAEAAVVGAPHDLKGECVVAFVALNEGFGDTRELRAALKAAVRARLGAWAAPEEVRCAGPLGLPKTRSGKILRRMLRVIAAAGRHGEAAQPALGDVSTLSNPGCVEFLLASTHDGHKAL